MKQDLNYRISTTSPARMDRDELLRELSQVATAAGTDRRSAVPAKLLAQDQLQQERAQGKTLHHLREGPIAFPPTYKYKPGSRDEFSPKRVPGWCDRVLYASAAGDAFEVLSYRSVMEFTRSDHKPVSPCSGSAAVGEPFSPELTWCVERIDEPNRSLRSSSFPALRSRGE